MITTLLLSFMSISKAGLDWLNSYEMYQPHTPTQTNVVLTSSGSYLKFLSALTSCDTHVQKILRDPRHSCSDSWFSTDFRTVRKLPRDCSLWGWMEKKCYCRGLGPLGRGEGCRPPIARDPKLNGGWQVGKCRQRISPVLLQSWTGWQHPSCSRVMGGVEHPSTAFLMFRLVLQEASPPHNPPHWRCHIQLTKCGSYSNLGSHPRASSVAAPAVMQTPIY